MNYADIIVKARSSHFHKMRQRNYSQRIPQQVEKSELPSPTPTTKSELPSPTPTTKSEQPSPTPTTKSEQPVVTAEQLSSPTLTTKSEDEPVDAKPTTPEKSATAGKQKKRSSPIKLERPNKRDTDCFVADLDYETGTAKMWHHGRILPLSNVWGVCWGSYKFSALRGPKYS